MSTFPNPSIPDSKARRREVLIETLAKSQTEWTPTWWIKQRVPYQVSVVRYELNHMEADGLLIVDRSVSSNLRWKLNKEESNGA